ncbi:MAG: endonuclease/exonuclease/phosphatase family protein [Bacteroidia bacterium]|nr:endonuclease/exonuclease/phosphatase family protein [Bacteroidia bacterium]
MKTKITNVLVGLIIGIGLLTVLGQTHFLLGSMLGFLQFPLMLMGLLILWTRRKKGFKNIDKALAFILLILFVNAVVDRTQRLRWVPLSKNTKEISLTSYNLFFKNNYKQNILNEIKANETDLLFVQELTPAWKNKLAPLLARRYKYQKDLRSRYTYGIGIYSKYPIISYKMLRNTAKQPFCQIAEISINNQKVVFVNVHLASPAVAVENPDRFFSLYAQNYKDRKNQMEELQAYLDKNHSGQAMVMVGDLNTPRMEPLYRKLRHRWADLYKKTGYGPGWTFPNIEQLPMPLITLDYILYRGKIKGKSFKVLPGSSSDHLAIYGKLQL